MNRLKELRLLRKMSLEKVASLANTTPSQIQKLETAERRMSDIWLERLAKALDVYPSEILPAEWQKPNDAGVIDIDLFESLLNTYIQHNARTDKPKPLSILLRLTAVDYEAKKRGKKVDEADIVHRLYKANEG